MNKELSVIVPVYNGEKYIDAFVKGITKQSMFEQLLFILVNDGSKDNTYERLKECEQKHPGQIKVLTKENGGVSSARNAGLEILETKYFTFADIDDLMHPALFERLYQMIQQTDADMVCAGIEKISVEQASKIDIVSLHTDVRECKNLDSESAIRMLLKTPEQNGACSKIYRTDKLGMVRFDERFAIAEDKLFVFQCMMKSQKVSMSTEKLYFYVQQPISAMSYANARKKQGQDIVLDIIDKEIKENYPNSYPLCTAIRAAIHAGSYIKVYTNDKDYRDKCKYYRKSVVNCSCRYALKEVSKIAFIKIIFVKYMPIVFLWKRIKNRKNLV